MKKILIISLALVMVLTIVAGCSGDKVEVVGETKTGLGSVISIAKSKDASVNDDDEAVNGLAQADVVVAAVTIDGEDKIVSVTIDTAQVRVAFDGEGKLATDLTAELKTKAELGEAYNMKPRSDIGKEWDEQIVALEEWMIGKTITEVKAMELTEGAPSGSDLVTSVTITVTDYIKAVEEAVANAK